MPQQSRTTGSWLHFAILLIGLLTLVGCQAARPIRIIVPLPEQEIQYQSWEDWTHPESGVVYKVPRMFLLGLKYESYMGEHYRNIMYADLADLLREQAWIEAAKAARDKAVKLEDAP